MDLCHGIHCLAAEPFVGRWLVVILKLLMLTEPGAELLVLGPPLFALHWRWRRTHRMDAILMYVVEGLFLMAVIKKYQPISIKPQWILI